MAKRDWERQVHFNYDETFMDIWNSQSQEMKDFCDQLGKPYGYTAQNVFLCGLYQLALEVKTGIPFQPWNLPPT